MRFHVLTLFPEMIRDALHASILGRALERGQIEVSTVNIRDFSTNRYNRVDDYPYGGGAGMVLEPEPVYQAWKSAAERIGRRPRTVYLTPQGRTLSQSLVEEFAMEEDLVLLCGHYEGIDERVLERVATDYVSIGDYVLTGGELGALVLIDAVSRFVPGVLGNEESSRFESFQDNLLEYPHYTRPEVWREMRVPEVLLSGDHRKIEAWRHEASLERTRERRPDLLEHVYTVTCACDSASGQARPARLLTEALSRYGSELDLGRRKIRRQGAGFGPRDLLVLALPVAEEDPPPLDRFHGQDTPAVLLWNAVLAEQEKEKNTPPPAEDGEELCGICRLLSGKGFRLEAVLSGPVTAEQLRQTSISVRKKLYGV